MRTQRRLCRPACCPAALPEIPGATPAAEYVAAGDGMDVGGDFCDVFALDDGAWMLVIGDVLGKRCRGRGGDRAGAPHRARGGGQEIELAPDDTLKLYTEGVTEARRDRPLTPEDLGAALVGTAPAAAPVVAREVVRLAERGAAGALRDDLALRLWRSSRSRARSPSRPTRDR